MARTYYHATAVAVKRPRAATPGRAEGDDMVMMLSAWPPVAAAMRERDDARDAARAVTLKLADLDDDAPTPDALVLACDEADHAEMAAERSFDAAVWDLVQRIALAGRAQEDATAAPWPAGWRADGLAPGTC